MHLFVKQMEPLAEKGIQIKDENGKLLTLKVLPLCCPVNSPFLDLFYKIEYSTMRTLDVAGATKKVFTIVMRWDTLLKRNMRN